MTTKETALTYATKQETAYKVVAGNYPQRPSVHVELVQRRGSGHWKVYATATHASVELRADTLEEAKDKAEAATAFLVTQGAK